MSESNKTPKWLNKLAHKVTKPFADKGVENIKEAINREFVQPAKEKQDATVLIKDFGGVALGLTLIGGIILLGGAGAGATHAVKGVVDAGITIESMTVTINYYGALPPT